MGLFFSFSTFAEIPLGYYTSLNNKSTQALKNELYTIISPHTKLTYNSLWTHFKKTDIHAYPDEDQWWDMYSNVTFWVRNGSSGMNREHSFPKSWWGGEQIEPYTDINHLYPSESDANMAKSNYPLGVVAQTTFNNGVTKVGYPVSDQGGGAGQVFEPADEYKGDFARTYFYMVTCYQNLTWKYLYMLQQNSYPTLKPWAYDLLLKWSRQDPVSQKEVDRNDAVYKIQNNRNPYIDYPELAEYIWGNKVGQPFKINGGGPVGDPILITPTQGTALDFSEVAVGSTQNLELFMKGENLSGTVTITITGDNKEMFKSTMRYVQASLINNADGYRLGIKYTPTSIGEHTAKVIISDGGMVGSIGIVLTGEALPVPVLSKINALPAVNATKDSYRAVWDAPSEVVDFYIVTRTTYDNGTAATSEFIAEENSYDFDDLATHPQQTYYVQSSRLGYRSVPSNVITVSPSSITGVETGKALAVVTVDGGVRFICSTPHTNAVICDMQGRMVRNIPIIENNDIIELPYGAYIIRTEESANPLKIFIK